VRFDDRHWDPAALQADLVRFSAADWDKLDYGDEWAQIPLVWPVKDGVEEHPLLAECDAFRAVLDSFPGRVMDAVAARLGPGGWIKEHRDISGGVAMGVARFHIPVVTHPDVEFYIGGVRCIMGEGEVWSLDTTYKHRLVNKSDVWRVHLIIDVQMNDAVRALYPPDEWGDKLHRAHFAAIVARKGVVMGLKDPRKMVGMARRFIGLKFFGRSSLFDVE
jgi:aspartyl/asparaginyl beta-hydroxylase (cupin superfamily)